MMMMMMMIGLSDVCDTS